jgi:hypothetical protein
MRGNSVATAASQKRTRLGPACAPLERGKVEHVEAVDSVRCGAPALRLHGDDPLGRQVPQKLDERPRLPAARIAGSGDGVWRGWLRPRQPTGNRCLDMFECMICGMFGWFLDFNLRGTSPHRNRRFSIERLITPKWPHGAHGDVLNGLNVDHLPAFTIFAPFLHLGCAGLFGVLR